MARELNTSRSQLDRLLDPENTNVTLQTLLRAARAVGRKLQLELV
jgi:DNA-binding phage protein